MATQQICACKNTCSRASKRGACPCRQTNRFCSSLCSCGTLKVCCTNQPEKMAVDTPVDLLEDCHLSSEDEWQPQKYHEVSSPSPPRPPPTEEIITKKRKKTTTGPPAVKRLLVLGEGVTTAATAATAATPTANHNSMDWEASTGYTARVTSFVEDQDLTTLRKITTELFLRAPTSFADYAGGYRVQDPQGEEPDLPNKPAWCRCGRCRPMPTARENKCCHRDQKQVLPRGHCVTTTKLFRGSVLNPTFVNTMAAGYYDVLCHEEQVSNEAFRYHAYRSYTFLTHGSLGAKNRKVVPSCCVLAIHERYPDPRGQYTGFQLP